MRFPIATRLNSFLRDGQTLPAAIRAAGSVAGLSALELNYPQHLRLTTPDEIESLVAETGLTLSGLNLRFEGVEFSNGAFTSPDRGVRERAIRIAEDAVELATRFGAPHVVLWMADDGFDYPFQVDYARLWQDEIDALRRIAAHVPSVRVSVEYKPAEPRRVALIRSMGEALLAARAVDRPNFGVTIDLCHSLMAGESPGSAAALALSANKLFGLHLNDGYGRADDGLMVGSIHPTETLEVLMLLRTWDYRGTLYFDTFPVREDPAAELAANIARLRAFERAIDRLDRGALAAAQARHDAVAALALVDRAAVGR